MLIPIIAIALAVMAGVTLLITRARAQRRPAELRGDWWSAFERDFRAYAATARPTKSPRRQLDPRHHTPRGE